MCSTVRWRSGSRLQATLGGSEALPPHRSRCRKIDWMQPTLEFLSPTLTEFLLFLVTLVLFIASWKDLRRALVMTFGDRDARLRTLRILNEIEKQPRRLSADGDHRSISCDRRGDRRDLRDAPGMPNPAGLGALAATLNFIPIIGPFVMFVDPDGGRHHQLADAGRRAAGAARLCAALTFLEGHFITPTIIGRRLALNALAVFIALAFWTWLWGPMGGFLASPMLIVALVLKEHLVPDDAPQLPGSDCIVARSDAKHGRVTCGWPDGIVRFGGSRKPTIGGALR